MTDEKATQLTNIGYDAIQFIKKHENPGEKEKNRAIKQLTYVAIEYMKEIADAMPPVSNVTLPFLIAALQTITNIYMEEGKDDIEHAVECAKELISVKSYKFKKKFTE